MRSFSEADLHEATRKLGALVTLPDSDTLSDKFSDSEPAERSKGG